MKWMASGSVRMFGVNYSAEQSVNTSTWTPAQLQQQIYLGNIIQDNRLPALSRFIGAGGDWALTYPDYQAFSFAARGAFTSPPSGKSMITSDAVVRGDTADVVVTCRLEVRTGATVNSGTLVHTSVRSFWRGSLPYTETIVHLVAGMTPNASYNVVQAFTATAGGGNIAEAHIMVEPVPA